MKPRILSKRSLGRTAVVICGIAVVLTMAGCGGSGGGSEPIEPTTVTISGTIDDGTENSPIQNAQCRFEDQNKVQYAFATSNQNGVFSMEVLPNIEGQIKCGPNNMGNLELSTYASTIGESVGGKVTENVSPAHTIVDLLIQKENPPDKKAFKKDLMDTIEAGSDPHLNRVVELATLLFKSMLNENIDVAYGGGGGGDGDAGDAGVGGDAGDGADKSPIANARCEFIVSHDLKSGNALYSAALADFLDDGILNRPDLIEAKKYIDPVVAKYGPEAVKESFGVVFKGGIGHPFVVTTDADGKFFLEIPPNVPGFLRCLPPEQEKLILATYVPELLEGEKRLGEPVNPATTVFSTNIATKLSGDLATIKDNFLSDIVGLDVQILQKGGVVSGFQLRSGTAPADKDVGLVAFSAVSLFNIFYKNGVNVDYLAALDDFTNKGEVDPVFLQDTLGVPTAQANEFSSVVDESVTKTGTSVLGTDIGSALSTARIIVMVTDSPGGDVIPGATVDIIGDISCDGCGTTTDNTGIVTLTLTGVPAEATEITVEASVVSGFGPATATIEVVAFATVNLEIVLRDGPPDTKITAGPTGTITDNSATFSYTGTDDVTPAAGLVYATYLQGYDEGWSDFDTATTRAFSNLPNGSYTFQVVARDQAGNEDPSPATRTFLVNYTAQPGALQFSSSTYSVSESGGSVTITVTRTGGSNGAVGVNYAMSNGTATAGSDYTSRSGTLSWGNGDSAIKTFSVPILNDSVYEGNETVNLTLNSVTGGATLGSPSSAVLTIIDNDEEPQPGALQFSSSTYSVSESGGSATITVTRTGGSNGGVAVSYATSNGTATAGSDYTSRSGTLSWGNGDSASKTFSVPILNDSVYEGNETVNLTLNSATGGATLGSPSSAVLTIIDDDEEPQPGALQFSSSTYSVSESGGSVTITVRRTGGSNGGVAVSYATSNGTATAGSDYTSMRGSLKWGEGDSANKTFSVPIINDIVDEPNETVNLSLGSPTGGATLGSPSTAVLTITDDEEPLAPAISNGSQNLLTLNDGDCYAYPGAKPTPGSVFGINFDYDDPDGDASINDGAKVYVPWDNTPWSSFTGDGYIGSIQTRVCFNFGSDTSRTFTVTLADKAGNKSNEITISIPRPPGAN